jgi:flavin-dependent dehydrogenase
LQSRFEEILAGWVAELGVPIHRGRGVVGFTQDDAGVEIEIFDGGSLRAQYLVLGHGGDDVPVRNPSDACPDLLRTAT